MIGALPVLKLMAIFMGLELGSSLLRDAGTKFIRKWAEGDLDLNQLQMAAQSLDQMRQRHAREYLVREEKTRARYQQKSERLTETMSDVARQLRGPGALRGRTFRGSAAPDSLAREGLPVPGPLGEPGSPLDAGTLDDVKALAEAAGVSVSDVMEALGGRRPTAAGFFGGEPADRDPLVNEYLASRGVRLIPRASLRGGRLGGMA